MTRTLKRRRSRAPDPQHVSDPAEPLDPDRLYAELLEFGRSMRRQPKPIGRKPEFRAFHVVLRQGRLDVAPVGAAWLRDDDGLSLKLDDHPCGDVLLCPSGHRPSTSCFERLVRRSQADFQVTTIKREPCENRYQAIGAAWARSDKTVLIEFTEHPPTRVVLRRV